MRFSELDEEDMVMVFFLAGFETVSILMFFYSTFLATNPDIQSRLLEEVDESNGEPDYTHVQAIKDMDMFISGFCFRDLLRQN